MLIAGNLTGPKRKQFAQRADRLSMAAAELARTLRETADRDDGDDDVLIAMALVVLAGSFITGLKETFKGAVETDIPGHCADC